MFERLGSHRATSFTHKEPGALQKGGGFVFRPLSYHHPTIPIVLRPLLLVGVAVMAGSLEGCPTGTELDVVAGPTWVFLKAADEGRRAAGFGPPETTFEVQLVRHPPIEEDSYHDMLLLCVAKDRQARLEYEWSPWFVPEDCLWRASELDFRNIREGVGERSDSGGSFLWFFRVSVDDAPSSVCLFFTRSQTRNPSSPSNRRIGYLCLADVPSPGVVRVSNVTCNAESPHDCKAGDIVKGSH
jgi:hypothetical protein